MDALLLVIIGVLGSGCLASVPAWVSAARLSDVQAELAGSRAETDKFRLANETLQKAIDRQEAQLERESERDKLATQLLTGFREIVKETR